MSVYITARTDTAAVTLGTNSVSGSSLVESAQPNHITSLQQMLDDLPAVDDGGVVFNDRSAVSAPSPWSAVITFDMFLLDESEKLHTDTFGALSRQAVDSWRALLAMIALNDLEGFGIQFDSVSLKPAAHTAHDADFLQVLSHTKPRNNIFNDESNACWDDFVLLRRRGRVLGILSNSALVCPPYAHEDDVLNEFLTELGLMGRSPAGNYELADPVAYVTENGIRYLHMQKWLEALLDRLKNCGLKGKYLNKLIRRTQDFAEALQENVRSRVSQLAQALEEEDFITFSAAGGSFRNIEELLGSLKPLFDFTIDYIKNRIKANAAELYLLDELSPALRNILNNQALLKNAAPKDAYITADEIFMDKITLINCRIGATQMATNNNTIRVDDDDNGEMAFQILWPLKNRLLDILPAETLYGWLSHDKAGQTVREGDNLTISLEVPMQGQTCRLSKTYPLRADVLNADYGTAIDEIDLPSIAIWPYMLLEGGNWGEYYVFTAQERRKEAARYKILFDRNLTLGRSNALDNVERVADESILKDVVREVSKFNSLPTYIQFRNEDSLSDLGYILLEPPKKIPAGNESYDVGLDFGTTSTTAFFRKTSHDDGMPDFVYFGNTYEWKGHDNGITGKIPVRKTDENFLHVVIGATRTGKDIYECFVPEAYLDRKAYPSLFQSNASVYTDAGALLNGNCMFETKTMYNNDYIKNNLKWDGAEAAFQKLYLEQIMTTIALKLATEKSAGTINWKFSYPTSLRRNTLSDYRNNTNLIIKNIQERTGIRCNPDGRTSYYPESIASARYFKAEAGASLYGCVDIGGGSSDVSFWQVVNGRPENLIQSSVRLASRVIFVPAVGELIISPDRSPAESKAIEQLQTDIKELGGGLKQLIEDTKREIERGESRQQIRKFSGEMESAILKYKDEFQKCINASMSMTYPAYIKFMKRITFGFFAILYYSVGSLELIRDALNRSGARTLDLYLAGNGSMLYNWIDSEHIRNMGKFISEMAGRTVNIRYMGEANLKTEAAIGLLNLTGTAENAFAGNEKIMNGEDMDVLAGGTKKRIAYNEEVSDEIREYFEEDSGAKIEIDPELPHIKAFILAYNEQVMSHKDDELLRIDASGEKWDRIRDRIDKNMNDEKEIPVFVVAVKAILDNL
ncbi:MAG: hypothetical protein LBT26_03785 [Clostridiales Family XIII bacterium]|jgi:hypothetical protein|nr:hypothetical protein [Clostridiales Family XIII bacterium]